MLHRNPPSNTRKDDSSDKAGDKMRLLGLGYTIVALVLGVMALIIFLYLDHQRTAKGLKWLVRFGAAYTLVMFALGNDFLFRSFLSVQVSFVYSLFFGLALLYFIGLALVAYSGLALEVLGLEMVKPLRKGLFIMAFLPLYLFIPAMKSGSTPADLGWVFHICAAETGLLLGGALVVLLARRRRDDGAGPKGKDVLIGFTLMVLICGAIDYIYGGPGHFGVFWPKALYGSVIFYGGVALAVVIKGIKLILELHGPKESNLLRTWRYDIPADLIAGYGISEREKEIAEAILQGLTNSEIAEEKCIAVSTVKKHVSNLFSKTSARNRVELIHILQGGK